jgi:AraC-like DNA-binding protein
MEWEMTALKRERLPAGATWTGQGALWALVLAGAVTLETADARRQVRPGTAVLVDAWTAHRLTADVETDLVHGDLRRTVPSTVLPSPLIVRGFSERQRGVVALVTACPLEVRSSKDLFSASYAGLIGAAMSALAHDDAAGAVDRTDRDGVATADAEVAQVVTELAARPEEPWTLDEMASLVHLSRSALTERFRRATGHTPMRMLREVRMHRARTLLAVERLSVTRVASEVGYGSVAAFSRAFAADHGVSPLTWRAGPTSPAGPTPAGLPESWADTPRGRPWVPSVPPSVSGAGHPQDRPAEPGGHRRDRADHQQQADPVAVQ